MIKNIIILIVFTNLFVKSYSQTFLNPDLNGIINGANSLPDNWQTVPSTDPASLALFSGFSDTPDLTNLDGPDLLNGINGNPYSGNTFISGLIADSCWHEGIMQTVTGLTPGTNFNINFQQSVVKQINCMDQSGSWAVYLDTILIGITIPTFSNAPFNSNSFIWEYRSFDFVATSNTHTFKFLPMDDDSNIYTSEIDLTGALRMGIDNINLIQICDFTINLGNDTTLCLGETLTLDATTTNATYFWQDNSTNPTFNVSQQGAYWVQVTVDNCTKTDFIEIKYNVALGTDTSMCSGETLILDATSLSNTTYLWQDNSTNPTFNVTQEGSYWVQISNSCGVSSDTINVTFNPKPIFNLADDTTLCQVQSFILDATTLNATYLWQDNSTNPTLNAVQQGTYWVEVTVNNCTTTDSINLYFNSTPLAELGIDQTLCEGETQVLVATYYLNTTYLWQDNSTNSSFYATQNGTYWVQITNGCGTSSDSINVNFIPSASNELGNDTILCEGEVLTLDATTLNATYLWQDNSTNSTYNVTEQGNYSVTTTVNYCSTTDNININFNSMPTVNLGNDTSLCQVETLQLDATTTNATYLWQDNSTNPTFEISQIGTYWVQVQVDNCFATDTLVVAYKECEIILEMPNVFTLNNDGMNDYFHPVKTKGINQATLEIFNRWGQKLFETNNISTGWDGKYSGQDCAAGTYFWYVHYETITNELKTISGFLTLIE